MSWSRSLLLATIAGQSLWLVGCCGMKERPAYLGRARLSSAPLTPVTAMPAMQSIPISAGDSSCGTGCSGGMPHGGGDPYPGQFSGPVYPQTFGGQIAMPAMPQTYGGATTMPVMPQTYGGPFTMPPATNGGTYIPPNALQQPPGMLTIPPGGTILPPANGLNQTGPPPVAPGTRPGEAQPEPYNPNKPMLKATVPARTTGQ